MRDKQGESAVPGFSFKHRLGSHLSDEDMRSAALILSRAYTRWQNNPRNTDPIKTDTSPPVYERLVRRATREVILYYEGDVMRGVFVHALSPFYDQYPVRKLSYVAVAPEERGYDPLRRAFVRYAEYMREQDEDVIITTDLEQETLNSLLEAAGFRETRDRNETYYLLSQLMFRKVFSASRMADDFVVDEIIVCDGQAIRRNKKLLLLQTTAYSLYDIYRQQQLKRVRRSIPEQNRELLWESLREPEKGIFFLSDFSGTITLVDAAAGGFDSRRAIQGGSMEELLAGMPDLVEPENQLVYLLPKDADEIRRIVGQSVLRPGFFDFLCFCYKTLGSFFVVSHVTPFEARAVLERALHPQLSLNYIHLIEQIFTPDAEPMPGSGKVFPDGSTRTAFRFHGPYVDFSGRSCVIRKDRMVDDILALKGDTPTPVVYLGNKVGDGLGVARLYEESRKRAMPVLVVDFGNQLMDWITENLMNRGPNPWFSFLSVRDYYQIPVMLEALGLSTEQDIDLRISGGS